MRLPIQARPIDRQALQRAPATGGVVQSDCCGPGQCCLGACVPFLKTCAGVCVPNIGQC